MFQRLKISKFRKKCQISKENFNAIIFFENFFPGVLFPVIQEILTEDVQEFVPYVFQILSLLLEYHNPGNITGPYMELFQFLLIPVLWERPGNIKPLVRLIQAYIRIGAAQVIF